MSEKHSINLAAELEAASSMAAYLFASAQVFMASDSLPSSAELSGFGNLCSMVQEKLEAATEAVTDLEQNARKK